MNIIHGKIMIVDDNIANLSVGRNLLKSNHEVFLATSAAQMFEMLQKVQPDLILLDIEMPGMNGYDALVKLKEDRRLMHIPVIFLTARSDEESELKGFDLGAADYMNKPFSAPLLLRRIDHQLLLAEQNKTIHNHMNHLEELVDDKVNEIVDLQNTVLSTVADLVEFRDKFTGEHIVRTQLYLKALIKGLIKKGIYRKEMEGWDINFVLSTAQLHDVGKIAIPDAVLNKPSKLTPEEFEIMKTHVKVGLDAVNKILKSTSSHAFLQHAPSIIGFHHEKWDGTGYPHGCKGEEIPLEGRLMAIADVYDALVSWRPYKKKFTSEKARDIILEGRGTHFDPLLVDIFIDVESEFIEISQKYEPEVQSA